MAILILNMKRQKKMMSFLFSRSVQRGPMWAPTGYRLGPITPLSSGLFHPFRYPLIFVAIKKGAIYYNSHFLCPHRRVGPTLDSIRPLVGSEQEMPRWNLGMLEAGDTFCKLSCLGLLGGVWGFGNYIKFRKYYWVVVSNALYVHPYLGKIAILTNICFRWVGSTTNQFKMFHLRPHPKSSTWNLKRWFQKSEPPIYLKFRWSLGGPFQDLYVVNNHGQ